MSRHDKLIENATRLLDILHESGDHVDITRALLGALSLEIEAHDRTRESRNEQTRARESLQRQVTGLESKLAERSPAGAAQAHQNGWQAGWIAGIAQGTREWLSKAYEAIERLRGELQ